MVRHSAARQFIAVAVLLTGGAYGQDASDQPQAGIRQLIVGIQQAVMDGSPVDRFFSPSLRLREKDKGRIDAQQKRGFLTFQIVDYSLKDLRLEDGQHASIPVTVKWSTRGEDASTTTTLKFVKDQGGLVFCAGRLLGSLCLVDLFSNDCYRDHVWVRRRSRVLACGPATVAQSSEEDDLAGFIGCPLRPIVLSSQETLEYRLGTATNSFHRQHDAEPCLAADHLLVGLCRFFQRIALDHGTNAAQGAELQRVLRVTSRA